MKYVLLFSALLGILPLSIWLRRNPRYLPKFWMLVGFLPVGMTAIPHAYIAVISWADWPGYVKGAEVSSLDVLLLALYLTLPKSQLSLPFLAAMFLYFLAVVISVPFAAVPVAALFYALQLARMFLVYVIVSRGCQDEQVVESILTGMMIALCFETIFVLWQRFALGDFQTPGTLGHQNGLGMVSYFAVFPLFALYLAGRKGWAPLLAPLAGGVIAVLTVSRATLGLAGMGFFGIFVLSAFRRFTPRLGKIGIVGAITILAVTPYIISSIEQRFTSVPPSADAYDERAAFENAARMMLSDHPMGVGANNFVIVANSKGYFERAGVAGVLGSRSANVHNAFLLAATETGYLGLVTFVLMLAAPVIRAFRYGWRARGDKRGDLLLGLGVVLVLVYAQSFFEWAFFLFWFQYTFAVALGLIAGLTNQLRYERLERKPAVVPSQLPPHVQTIRHPSSNDLIKTIGRRSRR